MLWEPSNPEVFNYYYYYYYRYHYSYHYHYWHADGLTGPAFGLFNPDAVP